MSDEQQAPPPKPTRPERVAAREIQIRDEREAIIRAGYPHDQRAMSGLVAATHAAYAGGAFRGQALEDVLAQEEREAASGATGP